MTALGTEELHVPDASPCDRIRAARVLRDTLAAAVLPLALPDGDVIRAERALLIDQLDDYLLPRLGQPERPLLIVVGGPTGVGKSTIVNTLVGERVSQSSMIRPTTRSPVLVHHPDDRAWFDQDGILPSFGRVDDTTDDPSRLQLVSTVAVPRGVALLDAPDFDSIDDANRALASRLLAAADMWLFVTSANRYADEVPWHQLEIARQRDTPLLVVLNRIQPEDLTVVSTDLVRQLRGRGIGQGKVVIIEHGSIEDGRLAAGEVADIRGALNELSASAATRRDIADTCVGGALRLASAVAGRVADHADLQIGAIGELLARADSVYDVAATALVKEASGGALLRGDLLGRWRELVGTDEALPLAELVQRVRERSATLPPARWESELGGFEIAVDLALEALIMEQAERAATAATRRLRATSYGEALLDWSEEDLGRPSRALNSRTRQAVAIWRRALGEVVADAGADLMGKRLVGVALAVGALSAPADGARGAGPVAAARSALEGTLRGLMELERDRYLQPVMRWNLTPDAPTRLRAARRGIENAAASTTRRS